MQLSFGLSWLFALSSSTAVLPLRNPPKSNRYSITVVHSGGDGACSLVNPLHGDDKIVGCQTPRPILDVNNIKDMTMRIAKLALAISVATFSLSVSAKTQNVTLGFENLPGARDGYSVNDLNPAYGGLNWSDAFSVLKSSTLPKTGYDYGGLGKWVGFTANADPVWFGTDPGRHFNFYGAYLASAWQPSETITVTGFLNGVAKYTSLVTITNNADALPTLYQFNWKNVDKIAFTPPGGVNKHIVFDNIQFSNLSAPVPEPETYALMGLGVVALALRLRRGKALAV